MDVTANEVEAVLKKQIASSRQAQAETGYDEAPVRARVARLAQRYGSPALDVGTGACACMAVALACRGLRVTAVDHASSAVRLAEERASGALSERLEIRYAEASRLPFADGSYHVVTAFDALCHTSEPDAVVKEMFRVSSHAVIITELNAAGREITRYHDGGFHETLPTLLARQCKNCQRFNSAHHVTYVCERS
jgi:ubiquinone/menaquinone biosynthesis C-methylase UbiE